MKKKTLQYVQKLLAKDINIAKCLQCNTALPHLFKYGAPLKHPLEYMVYRNICQIGSACVHNHILGECETYDPIADSILMLNVLNNNLQHLNYYLPKDDEDQRFAILKRLYDAMLLFCDAPVKKAPLKGQEAKDFLRHNMEKRIASIITLADCLQGLQDTDHGIEVSVN